MQKIQDLTAALEMAESRAAAFKQGLQSPYDSSANSLAAIPTC